MEGECRKDGVAMKREKATKFKTIKESDPEVFDNTLNEFMSNGYDIVEKRWHNFNDSMAITIEYRIAEFVPENLKEKYELLGGECYCGECPKLQISPDGRVKYHLCTKTGGYKKVNSCACNWYYCFLEGRRPDAED